jgi:prevent-host-death family protein
MRNMLQVSASEFAKNFGRYRDAAQREPVAVTSHDRITAVLISAHEYEEYQRFKRLATRALRVGELSDEALQAIASSSMAPRHTDGR